MADELFDPLDKMRIAAEITRALAAQMAELRELRESVQRAEAATVPTGVVMGPCLIGRRANDIRKTRLYLAAYS